MKSGCLCVKIVVLFLRTVFVSTVNSYSPMAHVVGKTTSMTASFPEQSISRAPHSLDFSFECLFSTTCIRQCVASLNSGNFPGEEDII